MSDDFDMKESLKPFVSVDVTISVAEALTKLREAEREFVLVTVKANDPPQEQPVSVLREEQLVNLAEDKDQKLSQLLASLPPLLVLEEGELKYEDLSEVLTILGMTRAAGFVVRLKDDGVGLVPRSAIARALPLEDIAFVGAERGEMRTTARTYICRQCAPPRRKRPRAGGAPTCDVWSHGTMQEA